VTAAIERVGAHEIITTDGQHRSVDTIILATGFETTKYLSVIDVIGRGDVHIADAWNDGASAYLGVVTSGFPNLFMLYGPNTNNGSILYMIECQVAYTIRLLDRMGADGVTALDVRRDAMDAYNEGLQVDMDAVEVWSAACNHYYRGPTGRIVTQWPHSMSEYGRRTAAPADTDDLAVFDVR
jgi:cation diffusion facilitator CzcD-associated flavoprotein CzcO